MATIWIDKDYMVSRSVIDSNVESSKIEPIIQLVQRKHMLRILGTDLYTIIDAAIVAKIDSGTTIPTAYKTLIDTYLQDILVYYTMYESSLFFKMRYTNKGIVVKSSENSQAAETSDIELIMENWKTNAETIKKELIKYLTYNPALFPQYFTNVTNAIWAERTAYEIDMYLEDDRVNRRLKVRNGNGFYNNDNDNYW